MQEHRNTDRIRGRDGTFKRGLTPLDRRIQEAEARKAAVRVEEQKAKGRDFIERHDWIDRWAVLLEVSPLAADGRGGA